MSSYLTEQQLAVMLGIRDEKSLEEIAKIIDRSIAWVQEIMDYLEAEGLMEREPGKHRGRKLTQQGKEALKSYGHPVN